MSLSFDQRVVARGWRVITSAPVPPRIGPKAPIGVRVRWLAELPKDAEASPRLNVKEEDFIAGLRRRFERDRAATKLTDTQMGWLRAIERKIHAIG